MDSNSVGDQSVTLVEITPAVLKDQRLQDRTELAEKAVRELDSASDAYAYRVGPQDVLSITVWDHPELTIPAGEFRSADTAGHLVAEDGTIFYPYVGKAKVAGMTVAEIRSTLTDALSGQIRNPQLDVRVAAFRSQRVYVVGAVASPGVQPISDIALTVLEAISRAGDVTVTSDMTNVTLTRGNVTYDIDLVAMYEYGDMTQNVILRHGDILSIPDRNLQKVFVLGAVQKPSTQIMHKGRLTLAEAISDAGGLNEKEAAASAVCNPRYDRRSSDLSPGCQVAQPADPGRPVPACCTGHRLRRNGS
jgi:polysaccharide export outer membrane protein